MSGTDDPAEAVVQRRNNEKTNETQEANSMMIFCVVRFSAAGPPFMRRSSKAGSLRSR